MHLWTIQRLTWEATRHCPRPDSHSNLQCRLYHSFPEQGRVERQLWAAPEPADPLDLFAPGPPPLTGDFHPVGDPPPVLHEPRGLTVDTNDHLFIADRTSTRHMDCSGEPLSYFRAFLHDVQNRTETAMPQTQVFSVSRLALEAQETAARIGLPAR